MDSNHKATDTELHFSGGKLAPWGSFIFWGSVVLASAFPWLGECSCTSEGSQAAWSGGWSCLGSLSSAHLSLPLSSG